MFYETRQVIANGDNAVARVILLIDLITVDKWFQLQRNCWQY